LAEQGINEFDRINTELFNAMDDFIEDKANIECYVAMCKLFKQFAIKYREVKPFLKESDPRTFETMKKNMKT
jgi:hypothetical protein